MSLTLKDVEDQQLSPMMEHYVSEKRKRPDCILFYRLGDFFELFFDDALLASRELELTLTHRDCGLSERAPMCGVPHHAATHYINRLAAKGYKVAICDQVEDASQAKGLVKREVVRIVTPGTITDASALDEKKYAYIASIYQAGNVFGLAACDVTSGHFETTALMSEAANKRLIDELSRLNPQELLVNTGCADNPAFRLWLNENRIVVTLREDSYFNLMDLNGDLLKYGEKDYLWPNASAGLLRYIAENHLQIPLNIGKIYPYKQQDYMLLDQAARRNLELTETIRDHSHKGSLLEIMDRTKTSMGSRLLRSWLEQPLLNLSEIEARYDSVGNFIDEFMIRENCREMLTGLYDLERLSGRIGLGTINARDLISLKIILIKIPPLIESLSRLKAENLINLVSALDPHEDLFRLLEEALVEDPPITIKEGGIIKDGFNEEVDNYRDISERGQDWLLEYERKEREETGIKNLRVRYNRVFGYFIEVTKSNLSLVPDRYIRKQTLTNAERYITEELKEREDKLLGAKQKLIDLEYELFLKIRDQIQQMLPTLQSTARALAGLDVYSALADLAEREDYCRPQLRDDDCLIISQGKHPVITKTLPKGSFVPNDLMLNTQERRCMVLTGPNMSGKSTYMRQNALIVLMAQMGSYVPAQSASIGLVDRIFTRVGAADDIGAGKSTFMVEMIEVANIMSQATPSSLLLLDEVGRGTSTYDGLAIAWAVLEHIADKSYLGSRTLFATHYHELTDLADIKEGIFNCHIAVSEQDNEIIFLHKIFPGGTDDSYGIDVAKLAGVPISVVNRARELVMQLEADNKGKRLIMRKGSKPQKDQIDIFSTARSVHEADKLIEEIETIDVDQLRPIDALSKIIDLKELAQKMRNKEKQ
ncbi:MAG TPA: DNA mismatch repair protein MutS [Clostridiaceae bacterium]|nr:DNA mismatch repair protein MutS [Clostridiaceae bacterium]